MSRSKLSNQELKFYNTSGASDVIYAKLKATQTDTLILEGASSATKVKLKNVADPTATGEVATFDYVNTKIDELSNGISWKAPVRLKSTANIPGTLSGAVFTCTASAQQTMDGSLVALNDRVLLAEQTAQAENGIYVCTTQGNARAGSEAQAVFTRATDADTAADLKAAAVFVEEGTVHADTAYVQTGDNLTLGTSSVVWVQFSSPGELTAGAGLTKTGNTFSANVDNSTIEIEAGALIVKDLGITAGKVATNSLTSAQIEDGSITANELGLDSVINSKILNGAVNANKLASDAVTNIKILNGAVNADKLASDAVTTLKVLDRNITTDKLADDCVTADKVDGGAIDTAALALGAVSSDRIGTGEVKEVNIFTGAVTQNKIGSRAVASNKIALLNVLTEHIADGNVTELKVASNSINNGHLKVNAVTTNKVADDSITADKLAANSVTTSKIGTLNGLTVNGIVNATFEKLRRSGGIALHSFERLPCFAFFF